MLKNHFFAYIDKPLVRAETIFKIDDEIVDISWNKFWVNSGYIREIIKKDKFSKLLDVDGEKIYEGDVIKMPFRNIDGVICDLALEVVKTKDGWVALDSVDGCQDIRLFLSKIHNTCCVSEIW